MLGCDFAIENGRYRITRVYSGENWNPEARAPLTQPGVNVAAGEYLLAVNGRDVTSSVNVYSLFEGTADKQVQIGLDPIRPKAERVTSQSCPFRQPPAESGVDRRESTQS